MSWAGITRIFLAYSFQQRLFQTIQTPATAPVPEFSSIYDTLKNLPPYWFPTLSATYDCLCMSSRQTYVIAMMPSLWLHLCLPDGHECNLQIAGLTCPKLPSRPLALCSGGRLWKRRQVMDSGSSHPLPYYTGRGLHAHKSLGSMLVPASSTRRVCLGALAFPLFPAGMLFSSPGLRVPIEKEGS